jgi:hypothetical protein
VGTTVDRVWFLTWHTYGTWLPGSQRGFVGETRDAGSVKLLRNEPGTPYAADMPGLHEYVKSQLKGPPILLSKPRQIACSISCMKRPAFANGRR